MDIRHDEGNSGEFYIEKDGKRIALLDYRRSGDSEMTITHTEVGEELAGQGIGKKLVAALAVYQREKNVKVHATCTYAHKVMSAVMMASRPIKIGFIVSI